MTADRKQIDADGRDVAVITIEIQDAKGSIVPDACPMLAFQLEGEGCIIGVGNGDPSYLGADHPSNINCKAFHIPAFNGLAQVIVQSGHTAGTLRLNCSAKGLKAGSVDIELK